MDQKNKRVFGLTLAILGLAFLLLNGVDYILGWNQVNSAVSTVGLILVVIGSGLSRTKKNVQQTSLK